MNGTYCLLHKREMCIKMIVISTCPVGIFFRLDQGYFGIESLFGSKEIAVQDDLQPFPTEMKT